MLLSTNLWFNACQQTYKAVKTLNSLPSGKTKMPAKINQQFNSLFSRSIYQRLHLKVLVWLVEPTFSDVTLCNRYNLNLPLSIRQSKTLDTRECKLLMNLHQKTTSTTIQMIKRSFRNLLVKFLLCKQKLTRSWRSIKKKEAKIRSMNGRLRMKLRQVSLVAMATLASY